MVLVVLLVEHYRSGSRTRSASSRNDSARDWLQILAVKSTICNTNSISSMCAPYIVGRGPHAVPVLHPASLLLLSNCLLAINRLCLFSWRNLSWDVFLGTTHTVPEQKLNISKKMTTKGTSTFPPELGLFTYQIS